MIYTVTLNPAIDYHMWLPSPPQAGKMTPLKTLCTAGGKGINVSIILKNLGYPSLATGFFGGFTGSYLRDFLQSSNIENDFISIEEASRINAKLHWQEGECEIPGTAPKIPQQAWRALLDKMEALKKGDFLVLSGSLPGGLPDDAYAQILSLVQPRGIDVFVDTSGSALKQIIDKKPFAIKPNHHELAELVGQKESLDIQTNLGFARDLFEKGIQNVIVSLGEAGAVLVNKEGAFHAQTPKGEVQNTIGAGDSLVAGFIAAHMEKNAVAGDALALAAACGTATAFSGHLAEKEMIESVRKKVKITNL